MGKEHSVVIVPGLGDETRFLALATQSWHKQGLDPVVYSVGWRDRESEFLLKLKRLTRLIDTLIEKSDKVSLVGTSAGGSAVLNAFIERKDAIHKVINVCGRLRTGPITGFRSFQSKTASSPAFAESIKLFEAKEETLSIVDRRKIMTVRAMFGDELVPAETTILQGAYNTRIPTPEHVFSIGMALTFMSRPLIMFLKDT